MKKSFLIVVSAVIACLICLSACAGNGPAVHTDTVISDKTPENGSESPSEAAGTPEGNTMLPAAETPSAASEAPSDEPSPTEEPTPEPTPEPTAEPTEEPTPTPEPTEPPTPEPTPTPTEAPTPTKVATIAPTPERPTPAEATPYATPADGSTFDIVINVVGDCMLASYKNEDADNGFKEYANREDPKYFLDKVAPFFESDDLTIVNLECVLTDKNLPPIEKHEATPFWYYGKTANTRILTEHGVEAVSLANNHMYDYGDQGLIDTVEAVKKAGLLYAGWEETFYYEKNGFRIAVICTNFYVGGEADGISNLVKEASKVSDFQIVFYHGGKMKIHEPEQWKIKGAHKIVDAGADLILGAHPHVLQPREIYNGVDIVYSLGNFCYGGSRRPENRTIIYNTTLTVNAADGSLVSTHSELIPCYVYTADVNNFQPAPITDPAEYQKVIDFMNWQTDSPV